MPSHKQRTVNIDSTTRALGNPPSTFSTSDSQALAASFPASPIHSGDMTPDSIREQYQKEVLNAVINDEGHTFGTYDTSYTNAPDVGTEVDTDKHNLPSGFVPNPTSPGPGSISAADQPVFNGELPSQENNVEFGSGLGGTASPAETSKSIAKQSILETYISGKSYAGSDGQT